MKTMKVYELTLLVTSDSLTTVLEVVKGSAELKNMKQVTDAPLPKAPMGYANGIKNKGITGREFALQIMSDGQVHDIETIREQFASRGFAASTAQPSFGLLVREGKIKKLATGRYVMASADIIKLG